MFKCTFCSRSVSHIGENAVQTGWGRLVMGKGGWPKKITVVHCPDHVEEYVDLVISLAQSPSVKAAKHLIQEAQRDR